ncbi:NAD(P)H-binding protein [Paenibacillus sp. MMS20-IR301]|uniref:NAD(P)H-binding protein n=1 Tax=Paenibacillus sp. MMS20-IR301 TaxID=2895946 RepID=UPI0028EA5010|nr:NAD(P)H-binding protein [Paenibacillus sp. MMS20-IR301]WNS45434.1 NAD(P)H-binding protein [Paenibacillus sp. MMS20-IR301]
MRFEFAVTKEIKIMTIMITGANGQLGHLIIKYLQERVPTGQIIAGVRRIEAAAELREQGVELRYTDYDVPDSLDTAFAGLSRLLLISSSHTDDKLRLIQHKAVIDAAKRIGVGHIFYTSLAFPRQNTGQPEQFNVHALTEQAIIDSGLEYTFLRNALYTDFVAVLGLKEALASGELVTAPGEWQFNSLTRQDLALAAAAVLAGSGAGNRIYELARPRTWNFADLAGVLAEAAGKPVVHRQDDGVQHWIYAFLSRLDTASTSEDLEQLTGRLVTSLKDSVMPYLV